MRRIFADCIHANATRGALTELRVGEAQPGFLDSDPFTLLDPMLVVGAPLAALAENEWGTAPRYAPASGQGHGGAENQRARPVCAPCPRSPCVRGASGRTCVFLESRRAPARGCRPALDARFSSKRLLRVRACQRGPWQRVRRESIITSAVGDNMQRGVSEAQGQLAKISDTQEDSALSGLGSGSYCESARSSYSSRTLISSLQKY